MTFPARIRGSASRSRESRSASNSPSASPSSQSAASPVGDMRGGHASSCPSTNSKPGSTRPACSAASAPQSTGQSPPISSGKRPLWWAARTACRTCMIMVISASSAIRPDGPRRGCGAGSGRSPMSVNPGRPASAADRPRWRSARGALATPAVVPLEFVGTPISTISRGIIPAGPPRSSLSASASKAAPPGWLACEAGLPSQVVLSIADSVSVRSGQGLTSFNRVDCPPCPFHQGSRRPHGNARCAFQCCWATSWASRPRVSSGGQGHQQDLIAGMVCRSSSVIRPPYTSSLT